MKKLCRTLLSAGISFVIILGSLPLNAFAAGGSIRKIWLTYDESYQPKKGWKISDQTMPELFPESGANYTVADVCWTESTVEGETETYTDIIDDEQVLEPDKTYYLKIGVTADTGYYFEAPADCRVNNIAAYDVKITDKRADIYYKIYFPYVDRVTVVNGKVSAEGWTGSDTEIYQLQDGEITLTADKYKEDMTFFGWMLKTDFGYYVSAKNFVEPPDKPVTKGLMTYINDGMEFTPLYGYPIGTVQLEMDIPEEGTSAEAKPVIKTNDTRYKVIDVYYSDAENHPLTGKFSKDDFVYVHFTVQAQGDNCFIYYPEESRMDTVFTFNGSNMGMGAIGLNTVSLFSGFRPKSSYGTVHFFPDGGTGSMADVNVKFGDYKLPECGFTPLEGQKFAGWKFNDDIYQPGDTIKVEKDDEYVSAVWENIEGMLVKYPAKEPTCTEDGCKEHYYDPSTGQRYFDKERNTPVDDEGLVIPKLGHKAGKAVKENEKSGSYESVVYCDRCGAELSRKLIDTTQKIKLGDVDLSGVIDIEDAVMVLGQINGVKLLEERENLAADVTQNGVVDIEDVVAIISHINGVKPIE